LVHKGPCNGSEPESFKDGLTDAEVKDLLRTDAAKAVGPVTRLVTVPLSQQQFDALVSFVFNVGEGNFKSSTLLKELNQGHYDKVPQELNRWVKAEGKTLPGLVSRRADEGNLFTNGVY
jgi:lysozyme